MAERVNLILLGPPGVGKGTQAELLIGRLGVPHISTGDMLREARAAGTQLGKQAAQYMDAGELVPDEVIVRVALERLQAKDCDPGFLLDGFPRTLPQAEALERSLAEIGQEVTLAVDLEADREEIVARLSQRRVCRACQGIFSLRTGEIKAGDRCPECGGEVYQREDDRPAVIRERLRVYEELTAPLMAFYRKRKKLLTVQSEGTPEEVFEQVWAGLQRALGRTGS
jgi:adenylate kinase